MNILLRNIFLITFLISVAIIAEDKPKIPTGLVGGAKLQTLRKNANADQLDVLDSYQEAIELEKEITQMYREVRAAKLSRIQRQSLKKSLKQTLIPISKRRKAKIEVLNIKAKDSDDVKEYQDELKKVMRENDAIVANAEEMLQSLLPEQKEEQAEKNQNKLEEMLQERTPQSQETIQQKMENIQKQTTEEIKKQMEQLEIQTQEKIDKAKDSLEDALKEMKQAEEIVEKKLKEIKKEEKEIKKEKKEETKVELAEKLKEKLKEAKEAVKEAIGSIENKKENIEEKIEQAREAMKNIAEALKETVEVDKELTEKQFEKPQKNTEKAVKELKKAEEDMKLAAEAILMASKLADMLNGKLSGDQKIAQQQALGMLAMADAGTYLDISKQMKGQDLNIKPEPIPKNQRPPDIRKNFNNAYGRKLVKKGGTPAVWYYVDKWYILGPYDNKGRMNIQKVYPPESIIDLDAYYLGKYNTKLRWIYDSFGHPMLRPTKGNNAYTIFYGFTELYFEEAQDLWIAIGSDDRSDLWINGMPVWHSSNRLKGWRMDEGYRKVHFKQGINKIVFRLENGWHSMGFSLMINTHKPVK